MAYKPLTDAELKDMHEKLKEQFTYAARMAQRWEEASFYKESNTKDPEKMVGGYEPAAVIVSAMADTTEALLAIERELRDREDRREPSGPPGGLKL